MEDFWYWLNDEESSTGGFWSSLESWLFDESSDGSGVETDASSRISNDGLDIVTEADLEASMNIVSAEARRWPSGSFTFVRHLADAGRNKGIVVQMEDLLSSQQVAVKIMPVAWMMKSPREFAAEHSGESERPWVDIGILRELNKRQFPHVCDLLGIFHDENRTYVVQSLATSGDLYSWTMAAPDFGREREVAMLPIVTQIFEAVGGLHQLGISHQDVSLENLLLTDIGCNDLRVKLVDFGHASVGRRPQADQRMTGKSSYQAPEIHESAGYDRFSADVFSLGVLIYAMALTDYPWKSTRKGTCKSFDYACEYGIRPFLENRKLQNDCWVIEILSEELFELLHACLMLRPAARATLEKSGGSASGCRSVWNCSWLEKEHEKELQSNAHKCMSSTSISSLSTMVSDGGGCNADDV